MTRLFQQALSTQARPVYLPDGSKFSIQHDETGSWASEFNNDRRFRVNACEREARGCKPLPVPPVTPEAADDRLTAYLAGLGIVPHVAV